MLYKKSGIRALAKAQNHAYKIELKAERSTIELKAERSTIELKPTALLKIPRSVNFQCTICFSMYNMLCDVQYAL